LISKTSERLIFFLLIFILICHIFGCIWIYTANVSQDEVFID
jgi:hypothetical protein